MDGIVINGQKVVIPGVFSEVEASELAGKVAASRGYIGLCYESERGGEPLIPYVTTSPAVIRKMLPARLATIIGALAFNASKDTTRIPSGGAQGVILVRVNPATRATFQLVDDNAAAAVDVHAKDWGNYGNDIIVTVEAGTTSGKKFTASLGSTTEEFDNVGDMDVFTVDYDDSDIPAGVTLQSMLGYVNPIAVAPAPVFYVNGKIRIVGGTAAFDPRAWMAFDGNQADASGRLKFTVVDQDAAKTITIVGTRKDTGAAVTDVIAVADDVTEVYSTHTFSEIMSIDVSGLTGNVDMEFSAFNLNPATYKTIAGIVDRVQGRGRGFTATFDTTKKTLGVENLDKDFGTGGTGADLTAPGHTFTADLYDFLNNVSSSIVTLSRADGALNLVATQGPSSLTGGADGVATTGAGGDWDKGFQALRAVNASHIVPRTGEKAVHELLSTHVSYMCGAGRNERIGFCGCPAGTGKSTATTGLYARSAALNDRNISFCPQEIQIYDENGDTLWLEPFDTALLAAACDAGRTVTDSITWATANILAYRDQPNHSTSPWNSEDDKADLIEHNMFLLETRPGTSLIQWTRDVTTWQQDDNPIFCSVFANEGLNASVKNVRQKVETLIGKGSAVVTSNAVKRVVNKELARQKNATEPEIKDYDPKSVNVEDLGNGFTFDYRVAPAEAIYFIRAIAHVARMPSNA